jgi:hypothetical protein
MDLSNITHLIDINSLTMPISELYPDERLLWPFIHFFDGEFPAVLNWCKENVEQQNWHRIYSNWYFRNEDDATLFRLTWL